MPIAAKTNEKNAGDLARLLDRAESPVGAHGVRQFALPSDRGSLEVSGANLMYEGARVKSWMLGRDVNPAGRGDGAYYAQGAFSIGSVRPSPTTTPVGAWGNSVNNEEAPPHVEKDPEVQRMTQVVISPYKITFGYRTSGECPHCYLAIPSPTQKGCFLTIHMYGGAGSCTVSIGCDCFPSGFVPPTPNPCGGNSLSPEGGPIFNPPPQDPCPGCDLPGREPGTNMPGPGIPGAPDMPGRPGIPGLGGGGALMGGGSSWVYGQGVPFSDTHMIGFIVNANDARTIGVKPSSWSRRFNECMRRCRNLWSPIPFNTLSPVVQGWYDFFMLLIAGALLGLPFAAFYGFDAALIAAINKALIDLLIRCGFVLPGSIFGRWGNPWSIIAKFLGSAGGLLIANYQSVSEAVWNAMQRAIQLDRYASCLLRCSLKASFDRF